MYARVPDTLKEPLLKQLRHLRLWIVCKNFPAVLLIFSAFAVLLVFVEGHAVLKMLRDFLPTALSDGKLIGIALGLIVTVTAAVMMYFLRQEYRDCDFEECLYCTKCDAVDKYDSGSCPVCQPPLREKAFFFFTTYKSEQKLLARWGLLPSRES